MDVGKTCTLTIITCRTKTIAQYLNYHPLRVAEPCGIMTTLLPDESHCKTELGTILYAGRKNYTYAAACTDQREVSGLFGHVEYDVEITVTPTDKIVNEPRRFKTVTRFKEMSKLFNQMTTTHKQLYLKDNIPNFPTGMMWGANAPEVIQERRRCIGNFLQFVVNNEVLCKTRVFQQFAETFEEILDNPVHSNVQFPPAPEPEFHKSLLGELNVDLVETNDDSHAPEAVKKSVSIESGPLELTEEEEERSQLR